MLQRSQASNKSSQTRSGSRLRTSQSKLRNYKMYRSNSQSEVLFQKLHNPSKREKDSIEIGYKNDASKLADGVLKSLNSWFGMSKDNKSVEENRFSTINQTPSSRYDLFQIDRGAKHIKRDKKSVAHLLAKEEEVRNIKMMLLTGLKEDEHNSSIVVSSDVGIDDVHTNA